MINNIFIDGYKCLKNVSISTGLLNVFVGANASGKSSVLQSLLLLRQSSDSLGNVSQLRLSGPLYEAGTVQDVLHPAAEHRIKIEVGSSEKNVSFSFEVNRDAGNSSDLRRIAASNPQKILHALYDRGDSFCYLNAERVGPRVLYSLPPDETHLGGCVGKYGEYTASVLARAKINDRKIDGWGETLVIKISEGLKLIDNLEIGQDLKDTYGRLDLVCNQVLKWVLPGSEFNAEEFSDSDTASIRFIRDPLRTKTEVRSTHIGFGLIYTLPIITAAFSIKKDGVIIVENPEAHLHPYSQSRMGVFLALIASTGRQVFLETHSDHVINGIRLAVKNNVIDSNAVKINYIEKKLTEDTSTITQINTNEHARLSPWPEGFFDQIEQDLSRL